MERNMKSKISIVKTPAGIIWPHVRLGRVWSLLGVHTDAIRLPMTLPLAAGEVILYQMKLDEEKEKKALGPGTGPEGDFDDHE
jgi:hypothetical protein